MDRNIRVDYCYINKMGGDYYDRDVISSSGNSGYGNNVVGLDPKTYVVDEGPITTQVSNPIVFALDVTGSMGAWPKIIYDKMPMFYGQIMMQKYLKNPALSFCAIGDATCDKAPLQVTRFGQGKEIDQLISKMWLEGGGGGNQHQSYELAGYFYNHYSVIEKAELPFFFVTGDEGFFEKPPSNQYEKVLGEKPAGEAVNAKKEWKELMKKYNVFHLKKRYDMEHTEPQIYQQWCDALGPERVIVFQTPKASVDIVLGLIALTSGVRNMTSYIKDMEDRGQDEERIQEVRQALARYAESLGTKAIEIVGKVSFEGADVTLGGFRAEYFKLQAKEKQSENRQALNKLQNEFSQQVSQTILCPITQQILEDPVIAADGHTYERQAITDWLKKSKRSPIENDVLENGNLIGNNAIKKLVAEWREKRSKKD